MLNIRYYKKVLENKEGELIRLQYLFYLDGGEWKGDPQAGINLGRDGVKPECNRKLAEIASHNYEAPAFLTYDEGDVYLQRVLADIKRWQLSRSETVRRSRHTTDTRRPTKGQSPMSD